MKNKPILDPFDWKDFKSSRELKDETLLEANRHEHATGMKN